MMLSFHLIFNLIFFYLLAFSCFTVEQGLNGGYRAIVWWVIIYMTGKKKIPCKGSGNWKWIKSELEIICKSWWYSWRETLAAPLVFFFFLNISRLRTYVFSGVWWDGTPRLMPSWLEALLLVLSYSQILPNYWIKYQQKQWLILTDTAGQIPRFFYSLLTLSVIKLRYT